MPFDQPLARRLVPIPGGYSDDTEPPDMVENLRSEQMFGY